MGKKTNEIFHPLMSTPGPFSPVPPAHIAHQCASPPLDISSLRNGRKMICFDGRTAKLVNANNMLKMWSSGVIQSWCFFANAKYIRNTQKYIILCKLKWQDLQTFSPYQIRLGLSWSNFMQHKADSRFAPSQCKTMLHCNDVSHRLGQA